MLKLNPKYLLPITIALLPAINHASVYEGFTLPELTAGQTINGQGSGGGWDSNWTVDATANVNNPLRYQASTYSLDYTDALGNSLQTSPGSLGLFSAGSGDSALNRPFSTPATGEVWFSFLNIRTSNENWGYQLQFLGADDSVQFQLQNNSNTGTFRINATSTASLPLQNHTTDENPQGQLFVGRVTNVNSGLGNSVITVWINPTNLLDIGAGATVSAELTGRTVASITQFNFLKGTTTTGYFDEFRVGNSSESVMPTVIPEPSTYALVLGLALGALLLRRQKRLL